jgi:hypothetical protein
LRKAIELSNHINCDSYEIESFGHSGDNPMQLKCEPALGLVFELDATQVIELDDDGFAIAVNTEGGPVEMEFIVSAPLRLPQVQTDTNPPFTPTKVLVTVSGGVADYVSEGDVMVQVFDFDNYADEDTTQRKKMSLSGEWSALAQKANVPCQAQTTTPGGTVGLMALINSIHELDVDGVDGEAFLFSGIGDTATVEVSLANSDYEFGCVKFVEQKVTVREKGQFTAIDDQGAAHELKAYVLYPVKASDVK